MGDIDETISEAVESASESKLNSTIAIVVSIAATFMALASVKSGNINQKMELANAKAVGKWGHFQSKSMKQNIAVTTIQQLESMRIIAPQDPQVLSAIDSQIKTRQKEVERYELEKTEIAEEATDWEKTYGELNYTDDQFDFAEAAFSVAIALCGVAALTQKWWLLFMSIGIQVVGFLFGLAGFMGWRLSASGLMDFFYLS